MEIQEKVIFEEELDGNFLDDIKKASLCEEIDRCIQVRDLHKFMPQCGIHGLQPQEDHSYDQRRL